MKKMVLLILCLIIIILFTLYLTITNNKQNKFFLEDEYYGKNNITEISFDELNNLIENKKSFAVFIYQPMCITSSDFEEVLNEFVMEKSISIYKLSFSNIKDTNIGKKIKYYPSFIIYENGKIVDYLEADKDEDVEYYSSKDGFEKWFTKYVSLKIIMPNDNINNDNNDDEEEPIRIPENINLDYIEKNDNKVNIYFFWGNGCPHCEEEFKMFESIKNEYGDLYNLYTFETWYNANNSKLYSIFASAMKDTAKGVPYTIIGSRTFKGFGENSKQNMIDAIKEEYNNSFDVYFDYLKK